MPFSDPSPENIETMLQAMKTRIAMEEWHANLRPTEYETHPNNLERFLQKHYMDLEVALNQWHRWVQWRHDMEVDAITDDVVKHEMAEGVFQWRGQPSPFPSPHHLPSSPLPACSDAIQARTRLACTAV